MQVPHLARVAVVAAGAGLVLAGCDLGQAPTTYGTGHAVSALALGDVDGDGDLDAVAACACPSLSILRNDGSGAFAATTVPSGMASTTAVTLIDLDGDGALDLSGTGTGPAAGDPHGVFTALGDGAGGFGSPTMVPDSAYDSPARPDVTGDGIPDLAHVPSLDNRLRLRAGDGTGGFGPLTVTALPGIDTTGGTTFADMDGDGDEDLVASGLRSGDLRSAAMVSPNDGTGSFGPPVHATIAGPASLTPTVADVNGDGARDILASVVQLDDQGRPYLTADYSVVLADGAGGYHDGVLRPLPDAPDRAVAAQMDADANVDVVFASAYDDEAWVVFGDGAGGFDARGAVSLVSSGGVPAVVGDVDGDGAPDVLTPRSTGVTVFLNRL